MEDGKRSFTLVEIRKSAQTKRGTAKRTSGHGGRYVSSTPSGAARKACSAACRSKAIRGQCTMTVTIKETTRGTDGKTFKYQLKRVKRDKPLVVSRGGVDFKIDYETKIVSLN